MGRVVGIDLGTTSSAIAVVRGGEVIVITTSEGKRLPSVVGFGRNGERLTGRAAIEQGATNPENTVYGVKRLLGRPAGDAEAGGTSTSFSSLRSGPRGDARVYIPVAGKLFSPPEIAAHILSRLRDEAEAYLGEAVREVVISVPAYFGEPQRQALKNAATIAGLTVRQIINEPTAVALSYGSGQSHTSTVMVVDLGGGSYDVSILDIREGQVTVRATSGDTHLGGTEWDSLIAGWIAATFLRRYGIDLRRQPTAWQRVYEAAEDAKIALSTDEETVIDLPFLAASADGPRHLHLTLTRRQFEQMAASLLERLAAPVESVLADAGLAPSALDAVLLVGGATRMPMVRRQIEMLTGQTAEIPPQPDQAVVAGAALQAGALAGEVEEVRLRDVTPLTLGLETVGGMMSPLIPRNTPVPVSRSQVFSTAEDGATAVEICVLQGERPMAADNETLGILRLEGIPAAPRGIPQIEVTFTIDENGLLRVAARELLSGAGQTVFLAATTSLTAQEVRQMVQEAERCAAQDLVQRNLVEARTAARQVLYLVERNLQRANGEIPPPLAERVMRQVRALQQALAGPDATRIRHLTAEVQQASSAISSLILLEHTRPSEREQ